MAWVVEAPPLELPPRHNIFALLRAEWRQSWWLQTAVLGAGLGVWALLHVVTERVPTDARPEGVVFNYLGSLLLSVFPVLLSGPALTGIHTAGRVGFWCGLPLARRTVNLLRILGLGCHLWPAVLTWPLIISVLSPAYGPVSVWLMVNAALLVGLATLMTTRTALVPLIVYLLLPLQVGLAHFVPGGRPWAETLAAAWKSPWLGAGLFVAFVAVAVMVFRSPPPRRT